MSKTDKEQDRNSIQYIIAGGLTLIISLVALIVCAGKTGGFLIALLVVGCLFGALYVALGLQDIYVRRKQKAEAEEEQRKQDAIAAEINRQAREGTWVFPSEEFYDECKDANITSLESEYSIAKARKIAENLLDWYITPENGREYLKTHNLRRYLAEGKVLSEKTESGKIAAEKQPRDAQPTRKESVFIQRAKELSLLSGNKKRVKMLKNLLGDYDDNIKRIKDGEEALKQLGMIYAAQQKKESSWAIMGGIADGIAGPAAGLAAAADTMARNAKVREHNAAVRKASMDIMSGVPNLVADRYQLEKEREQLRIAWISAENKVALSNPKASEIWKNVSVGSASVEKNTSGVLAVSLPIKFVKPFTLDVPKGTAMVIDGTIKGQVLLEDKLMGEVLFPLPLQGIPSNMTEEIVLDGMCERSVQFDGEYTVNIYNSQELWVMEA